MESNKNLLNYKIAISGPQGCGKTTLMNYLKNEFGLNTLSFSTESIMKKYHLSSHLDVLNTSDEIRDKFQSDLVRGRRELFKNSDVGFISDRAVLDSYIYFLNQNVREDNLELKNELEELAILSLEEITLTVLLTPIISEVENNGVRVSNLNYYNQIRESFNDFYDSLKAREGVQNFRVLGLEYCDLLVMPNEKSFVLNLMELSFVGMLSVEKRAELIVSSLNWFDRIYLPHYAKRNSR